MILKVTYKNKKLDFPTSWNDLSVAQLAFVSSYFHGINSGKKPSHEEMQSFRLLLIKSFTKLSLRKFQLLTKDELADLVPLTGFIFNEPDLSTCILRRFFHKGRWFMGLDKYFDSLTFGELGVADTHFINYVSGRNEESLNKLVATLFRSSCLLPLNRPKYDEVEMEKNAKLLASLPADIKISVFYLWYGFRKNVMQKTFPNLFPKPNEKESGTHGKKVGNDYGYVATTLDLAGSKFGSLEETKNQCWFDVFAHMSMEKERYLQRKING